MKKQTKLRHSIGHRITKLLRSFITKNRVLGGGIKGYELIGEKFLAFVLVLNQF